MNPRSISLWQMLLYALIGAPCALVTLALQSNAPYGAQSVQGEMTMFEAYIAVFALLATVSLLPNRVVEIIKRGRIGQLANENVRAFMLLLITLLVCEIVAFTMNLNVIAMLPQNSYLELVPHTAGVFVTGGLLAAGANFWHELGETAEQRLQAQG